MLTLIHTTRTCIGCFKEFEFPENFYKHPKGPGGYSSRCKKCYYRQSSEWSKKNSEKVKQYRDKYSSSDKGKRQNREYYKEWITPEKRREYNAKHRAKNSKYSVEWYRNHEDREHINEIRKNSNAKRRALKKGSFVENVYSLAILELDDGICQLCFEPVNEMNEQDYTIDHIIPISRGGEHSYHNCQLAHRTCNSRKHNKLIEGSW